MLEPLPRSTSASSMMRRSVSYSPSSTRSSACRASLILASVRKPSPPRLMPRMGVSRRPTLRAIPSSVPSPPSTTTRSARCARSSCDTGSAPIDAAAEGSAKTFLRRSRSHPVSVLANSTASGRSRLTTMPTDLMGCFGICLACSRGRGWKRFSIDDGHGIDVITGHLFAGLRAALLDYKRIGAALTTFGLDQRQHVLFLDEAIAETFDDRDLPIVGDRRAPQHRNVAIGRPSRLTGGLNLRQRDLRRQRYRGARRERDDGHDHQETEHAKGIAAREIVGKRVMEWISVARRIRPRWRII